MGIWKFSITSLASFDGLLFSVIMVNHGDKKNINQEGADKAPSSVSEGGCGGATRHAVGTHVSGQSISTSGSVGSPLSRSETAATTTSNRMNNLDIQGEDAGSRAAAGLQMNLWRNFQILIPDHSNTTPDQQQYDEKNIRRRVSDELNVLMAMDIISKDKKEIQWKGLPRTSLNDVEELKHESLGFRNRIEKKAAYLAELEEQHAGLQNLTQRNEQQYCLGSAPSGGVALPFIMVQTRPQATVEVEQKICSLYILI
ncbi:transcription factor-like protein DPB [Primulina tabacum]|uniref:transcription factor-like protein DPB n=1 Tax=Primulina tabacum TaxID=48773 RepID=UPI003F59FF16